MNSNEWETTWVEQNAKAEMIGGAFAVGCVGLPVAIIVLLFFIVAIAG